MTRLPALRARKIPWAALSTRIMLAGIALVFMALFPGDTPGGNSLSERVLGKAKDVLYNYAAWEVEAIAHKLRQVQSGLEPYLSDTERSKFVIAYARQVGELQTLESQIRKLYSDPTIADKELASASLRAERDKLKAVVAEQQPLAEAIIDAHIASILRDEGFSTLGEIIPAVSARITELPMLLVVSPRNVIRRDLAINVVYMSADAMTALESEIDRSLKVSSLVVPIGGLALYPSMIIQTSYVPFLYEVVAHEWAHHYLLFFPLGLQYLDQSSSAWIINETTASQFGSEIGRKALERFYKGLITLPPEPTPRPTTSATPAPTPTPDPAKPAPFDFAAEMNTTRVTVDRLLAEGRVTEAEAYMETQRQWFVANGYVDLRKLNQAYFAFYGGYQSAAGGGSAGEDPIGPAIGEIRRRSPSIKAWMETMRVITSREDLLTTRERMR